MSQYVNNKFRNLNDIAKKNNDAYLKAHPFPYIAFNNFFDPEQLKKVVDEFPDLSKENAISFNDKNQKKFAGRGEISFKNETRAFMHFLNSSPFLEFIQTITGIEESLLPDPYFSGGGLHEIKRGGLLKIHADFNKHKQTGLDRRVNALIYLNENWKEEYGGHLELWDDKMDHCEQRILPVFNTLILFTTTDYTYHGHPNPLTCPPDRSRKSLALYYYTNGRPETEINPSLEDHSTLFQTRKGNKNDKINAFDITNLLIKEITPPLFFSIANIVKSIFIKRN